MAESSTNSSARNLLAVSNLSSKTITGCQVYQRGSAIVIELTVSSGGPFFIKVFQGQVEFGTSADWQGAPHYSV